MFLFTESVEQSHTKPHTLLVTLNHRFYGCPNDLCTWHNHQSCFLVIAVPLGWTRCVVHGGARIHFKIVPGHVHAYGSDQRSKLNDLIPLAFFLVLIRDFICRCHKMVENSLHIVNDLLGIVFADALACVHTLSVTENSL